MSRRTRIVLVAVAWGVGFLAWWRYQADTDAMGDELKASMVQLTAAAARESDLARVGLATPDDRRAAIAAFTERARLGDQTRRMSVAISERRDVAATFTFTILITLLAVPTYHVGALAVRHWLRARRCRNDAKAGLCPSCGYDLRATPGRCPECGAVPTVVRAEPEGT